METTLPDIDYIAETTAAFLGTDWVVQPKDEENSRHWGRELVGRDDTHIRINTQWQHKDRLVITGDLTPTGYGSEISSRDLDYDKRSITVRADRGPKVIAAEVSRRLLPEVTSQLKIWRERVAEHLAYVNAQKDTHTAICEAIGIPDDGRGQRVYWSPPGPGYGHLEARGERVDIDLHGLPRALAIKVAELLRKEG